MFDGEKCSFIELAEKYIIEIPVIQRDYAQGRQVGKAPVIRKVFLDDLYEAIKNWDVNASNSPLELHFIYGTKGTDNEYAKDKFIPLDGQQRLTTLFLIHWFLALKEGRMNDEINGIKVRDILISLKYKTRTSSEKFIESLVKNSTEELMNEVVYEEQISNKFSNEGIVANIINAGWFFSAWENDPTVEAMLVMINDIAEKFKDEIGFFEKLTNANSPITFRLMDIDQKNEDVFYIRMNSRGKPLTDFENFKAELLGYIKDKELKNKLVGRIEGKWTEFFWKYKDGAHLYDSQILNMIRILFSYHVALAMNDKEHELLDRFILDDYLPFDCYKSSGIINNDTLDDIIRKVDILCEYTDRLRKLDNVNIKEILGDKDINDVTNNSIINRIMNNYNIPDNESTISYPERVRMYAYLCFFENLDGNLDEAALVKWMNVVCNIVKYNQIDAPERFSNALTAIRRMLVGRDDIYSWMQTQPEIPFFSERSKNEEYLKSALRLRNTLDWNGTITEMESHGYLDGQIMFLLEYSNITMEKVKSWDMATGEEDQAYNELKSYYERFKSCFNADGCIYGTEKYNYIWQRALLATGDYLLEDKSNFSFLVNSGNYYRRDITWKWLFQEKADNRTEYVKQLFSTIDINDTEKSLKDICNNFLENDWRYYFIKYPEIINACGKHYGSNKYYVRWSNSLDILLMETVRLSGMNREYYAFALKCYLEQKYKGIAISYPPRTGNGAKGIEKIGNKEIYIEFSDGHFVVKDEYNGNVVKTFKQYSDDDFVEFDDIESYLLSEGILV